MAGRRGFGNRRKLPSGRWQASYADPHGRTVATSDLGTRPLRHVAPHTFESAEDAEAWLTDERRLISAGTWTPPAERAATRREKAPVLADYGPRWIKARKVRGRPLADRTRDHYTMLLDRYLLPAFGSRELRLITPEAVAAWYDSLPSDKATIQTHAYSLLRSVLATAADPAQNNGSPLIPFNPAAIRGAGSTGHKRTVDIASVEEVATIVGAMPEKHRLLVLLADGTGLRFGELAELRRKDVRLPVKGADGAVIRVRRSVARSTSAGIVRKAPKSAAGVRDVPVPPHLVKAIREHLLQHAAPGAEGLFFPSAGGENLAPSSFYGKAAELDKNGDVKRAGWGWYEARRVAGRDDLHLHDLRHGALTEAARHGATLADLMALAGHSTPAAAHRYQQSASDRLADLARMRSAATGWTAEADA